MRTKFLIGIVMLLFLALAGCSAQTTVKYQCVDGSFVDSANSCSSVICKTNCPKLDCINCPAKIEYKDREVEKEVYVDKPIYKYQCFDGTSADSITTCKYTATSSINKVGNCDNNEELRKMDIWFNDPENIRNFAFDDVVNIWYPGENEGKILGAPLFLKNTGCKKIEPFINMYLYDGNQLIYTTENREITFKSTLTYASNSDWRSKDHDTFYPDDWAFTYQFLNEEDGFNKLNGVKITSLGDYRLKVIVKDSISGEIVNSGEIKLIIKST
ncbi:MAG: hypothetical protein AABX33_04115 [Nanoarchaeota archaeon]